MSGETHQLLYCVLKTYSPPDFLASRLSSSRVFSSKTLSTPTFSKLGSLVQPYTVVSYGTCMVLYGLTGFWLYLHLQAGRNLLIPDTYARNVAGVTRDHLKESGTTFFSLNLLPGLSYTFLRGVQNQPPYIRG